MKALSSSLVLLSLLAGPLFSQAPSAILAAHAAHQDPFGPPSPLRVVVLTDASRTELGAGWRTLLATPTLLPFQIPVEELSLRTPAGAELVARLGLPHRPGWALLTAREGRALSQGEALPDAQAFLRTLQQAGATDPTRALRAYLKVHPDVLEARVRLLTLVRRRAEAAALRRLALTPPAAGQGQRVELPATGLPGAWDLSQATPLSPAADLEVWGAYAQELDALFRTGRWREVDFAWLLTAQPLDATSPTLRALYTRWRPEVEQALNRQPENPAFWNLWIWMGRCLGDLPLGRLLAGLAPSPLTSAEAWPPDEALRALRLAARSTQDWRALQPPYLARWRALRPVPASGGAGVGTGVQRALAQRDWDETFAPLLEACLRGGAPDQADALVREARALGLWPDLSTRAAILARSCGAADLAAAWSTLGPGAPR